MTIKSLKAGMSLFIYEFVSATLWKIKLAVRFGVTKRNK
jgi:hypothetical protein